jgi:hypothetical protein
MLASGEAFQAVTSKFVMKQQAPVQESVRSGFDELMKGASTPSPSLFAPLPLIA